MVHGEVLGVPAAVSVVLIELSVDEDSAGRRVGAQFRQVVRAGELDAQKAGEVSAQECRLGGIDQRAERIERAEGLADDGLGDAPVDLRNG
ncbi:hypothetical protein [Kitasatospora sp. NPDC088783]|uniref:hypothetical protein n=1 Tax=Kitasatospora sp. NPDC088783 TaxID=3364077 RepID=UPI003825A02A